jgi:methyl-accepting chemotaxis protein
LPILPGVFGINNYERQMTMLNTIKSKLVLLSFLSFVAVGLSVILSYFIAVHEIKIIMRNDVDAVANSLEKSIDYIAEIKPEAYKDKDFKQFIYDVKLGKSGYVFMMNADGIMSVHATNEGANLSGNKHIDFIKNHKEPGILEYASVSTGQEKIVAYRYIEPWGLWVVPGVNKADYFDQLKGNFLKWNISFVVLISILLLVASFRIIRGISVPIMSAVEVANRLATGDLTMDIPGGLSAAGGEIGSLNEAQRTMVNSLNTMVVRVNASSNVMTTISENLAQTARQVVSAGNQQSVAVEETSEAVHAINASVREVAQGVDSLSKSASETSSSTMEMASSVEEVALNMGKLAGTVEEVSSSILEMTTAAKQISGSVQVLMDISSTTASSICQMDFSIKQVGEHARISSEIAREVLKEAEAGRESVHATIAGIAEIKSASHTTSVAISALAGSAADISEILRVIDDITDQTNLLALNAAIIAAQAGEHGKGFAVVAGEIKQLADRTKNSTKEIGDVISGVLKHTELAVKTIAAAESSIESGSKLSRHSGEVLDSIYLRVKHSADQVAKIAVATVEQAAGSNMISQAMENNADMIVQIRNATREQERGNEMIMAAVEQIKGMNNHVRNSTREQINASKGIASSTENIDNMSKQIKQACAKQSACGDRIIEAIERIFQASGTNNSATTALNEAVSGLVCQVKNLKDEMGSFQTKIPD